MARADIYTILPLDDYARIIGISPLHFNGGKVTLADPTFKIQNSSSPIWFQFDWQSAQLVSREDLAIEIANAEREIMQYIGYWPAPVWVAQEISQYPKHHRPEMWASGINSRGQFKTVRTESSKIITPGQRAVTLIDTATVAGGEIVFSDPQSQGWNTLVTITVPTTLTDISEIKVYFVDQGGDPIWEIRPAKTKTITGGNAVFTFDSWLLFDPDLVNAFPTDEWEAIIAETASNYVTSVEVYREFTDITLRSAQFFWQREPTRLFPVLRPCPSCSGTNCEACSLITQDGCAAIANFEAGSLALTPATFDATDERWEKAQWAEGREPDMAKVWYKAGNISNRSLQGYTTNDYDPQLARAVAILASTRLTHQFNANNNIAQKVSQLQIDTMASFADGASFFTSDEMLNNPFGTRRGEIMVYKQLKTLVKRRTRVGIAVA